jgi:hypothetical protein
MKVLENAPHGDLVLTATILTSLTFFVGAKRCFVYSETEPPRSYSHLSRASPVTHRIRRLDRMGEYYYCEMIGSDDSVISFYLGMDDLQHNRAIAAKVVPPSMELTY